MHLGPDLLGVVGLDEAGCMMTSLPGSQSMGVVTLVLVARLQRVDDAQRTSAELVRPVEAGYERIRRIVFLGLSTLGRRRTGS